MTEKRFTSYKNNERIVGFKDNVTGKHHASFLEAIWVLNALHEENQQLKEEVENLKQALIKCAFDNK